MSAPPIRRGSPLFQPSRHGRAGKTPSGPAGARPYGTQVSRVAEYYLPNDKDFPEEPE